MILTVVSSTFSTFSIGSKNSLVVQAVAGSAQYCQVKIMSFNFRGVMESEGKYDNGIGEEEDVKTACEFLLREYAHTNAPLLVCGFSFGAWVGLKYGSKDERVKYLVGLGLPLRLFDAPYLKTLHTPKLIIWGDQDEYNPMEKISSVIEEIAEPKTIEIIDDADHFFTAKLHVMREILGQWVRKTVLTETC
jgi:alpha/beta superfamily hydrolase